jgi:hypothetical protein
MKNVRRTVVMVVAAVLLATWGVLPCCAAESAFKDIFQDALYGGAVMAFTQKAGDHLDYLGCGSAGGVPIGTAVGLVSTAKSPADADHGKVRFAVPTIFPDFQDSNSKGQLILVGFKADLFRGKF